jgi:hypothetical protein
VLWLLLLTPRCLCLVKTWRPRRPLSFWQTLQLNPDCINPLPSYPVLGLSAFVRVHASLSKTPPLRITYKTDTAGRRASRSFSFLTWACTEFTLAKSFFADGFAAFGYVFNLPGMTESQSNWPTSWYIWKGQGVCLTPSTWEGSHNRVYLKEVERDYNVDRFPSTALLQVGDKEYISSYWGLKVTLTPCTDQLQEQAPSNNRIQAFLISVSSRDFSSASILQDQNAFPRRSLTSHMSCLG